MKKNLAEFVGTFVLVLVGVGAAVLDGKALGPIGISLAFGLALVAMVYAVGPISGCHLNPAVTFGLAVAGRCKWADVPGYVVAQCIGAIAATFVLYLIAGGIAGGYDVAANGFAANGFDDHSPGGYGMTAAFLAEMFFTFVLVLTVLGATADRAPAGFAGLPIGFALTVTNFASIPVTNASINPAGSLGPALFVGGWALGQLWLFILAPIVGGILAAVVYHLVRE